MRLLIPLFAFVCISSFGQDVPNPRPLTMEEYEKGKSLSIKNLDEDTYAKFDNTFILDRYELRKPYFVKGDDGLKKRIDLYTFIAKDDMQQLGILIFYTNEKNVVYKALLPNFTADGKVWEKYFEDIHAIDKLEKNFVLKLSYIMSKELGYQIYKSLNAGKDLAKESATYGNDICFPGDQQVMLSNGSTKQLSQLVPGEKVVTINAVNNQPQVITVEKLIEHEAKNYAITILTLIQAAESESPDGQHVHISSRLLKATPNHPMRTELGEKPIGKISAGERVLCFNDMSQAYEYFEVLYTNEVALGKQKVYNISGSSDSPFLMNGVMVLQK